MGPSRSTRDNDRLPGRGGLRAAPWFGAALVVVAVSGCWGGVPDSVGVRNGQLAPCPSTPNCVHTGLRHPDGTRSIYLIGAVPRHQVIDRIRALVEAIPRTTILSEAPDYLHAEVRSRLFRFVDDVEVLILPDGEVVVRSASRVGKGDMGVNAARVEALRASMVEAGLIR